MNWKQTLNFCKAIQKVVRYSVSLVVFLFSISITSAEVTDNLETSSNLSVVCEATIEFKNTGCNTLGVYINTVLQQNIAAKQRWYADAPAGTEFTFIVNSVNIGTYTVVDCSNVNLGIQTGGTCTSSSCSTLVWFKNTGCNTLTAYRLVSGTEIYALTIAPGGLVDASTYQGAQWVFKVNNTTLKQFSIANCGSESHYIDSGGCTSSPCNSTVWIKNTGCQTISAYISNGGSETFVSTINASGSYGASVQLNQIWVFKVGGNTINTWTVTSCNNSSLNLDSGGCTSGGCTPTITFRNTGCISMKAYRIVGGSPVYVTTIASGGSSSVVSANGENWVFEVSGYYVKAWTVNSCYNATWDVNSQGCSSYGCSTKVWFKNTGCRPLKIYWDNNGYHQFFTTLNSGGTWGANTKNGHKWLFKVDHTIVSNWTVNTCSEFSKNIDSGGCYSSACNAKVWFKNTGCRTMEVYWDDNGYHHYYATVQSGGQWGGNTVKGHKWLFKVNGAIIKNWIVNNCYEFSKSIDTGGCHYNACSTKVWYKNTGCQSMKVYWDDNGYHRYYTTLVAGATWGATTKKGHIWLFKVGNQIVKTWTVDTCNEFSKNIDSGGCHQSTCKTKVTFKNSGCAQLKVYYNDNGDHVYFKTMIKSEYWTVNTYKNDEWIFKVNHNIIDRWTATTCSEKSIAIKSGGCETSPCEIGVSIKNTGCQTLKIYKENSSGTDEYVASLAADQKWTDIAYKGEKWTFEADDNIIGTWTASTCNDVTKSVDSGGCTATVYDACLIANDDFEADYGMWNKGGYDAWRSYKPDFLSGKYVIRLRDNTGANASIHTDEIDLSGYSAVTLDFQFIAEGMESGKDFLLEYSLDGGSQYNEAHQWVSGTDFDNNFLNYALHTVEAEFSANTVFRLRADGYDDFDKIFIDEVRIYSCDGVDDGGDEGDGNEDDGNTGDCTSIELEIDNDGTCDVELYLNDTYVTDLSSSDYWKEEVVEGNVYEVRGKVNDYTDTYTVTSECTQKWEYVPNCDTIPADCSTFLEVKNNGECILSLLLNDNELMALDPGETWSTLAVKDDIYRVSGTVNSYSASYTVTAECEQQWDLSPDCSVDQGCTMYLLIENDGECDANLLLNGEVIKNLESQEEWTTVAFSGSIYEVQGIDNDYTASYTVTEDCEQKWEVVPECSSGATDGSGDDDTNSGATGGSTDCDTQNMTISNTGTCDVLLYINGLYRNRILTNSGWSETIAVDDKLEVIGVVSFYYTSMFASDLCEQEWEVNDDLCTSNLQDEDTETATISRSNIAEENTVKLKTITEQLNVYPNPTNHTLKIDGLSEGENYNVFSLDGRLIHKQLIQNNLDVSILENGVYIIKTSAGKVSRFMKF